jgi:AbrB family looped-hinge helix DNA binding protein
MASETAIGSMTTKGQVTVPKEIRDALDLHEGDKLLFGLEGDHAVLRKAEERKLSEILRASKPWRVGSIEFQSRLREEWSGGRRRP